MNATSSWYGTTGAHPGLSGPIAPQPCAPTRWPVWRIVDLVATICLFGVYAFEVLALLYFSIFWTMAADSCGTAGCDYGKLSAAYVLNDIGGVVVYLVTLVVAVALLVLRKPAFWLPIVGGLIQVALLAAALGQLAGVSPT